MLYNEFTNCPHLRGFIRILMKMKTKKTPRDEIISPLTKISLLLFKFDFLQPCLDWMLFLQRPDKPLCSHWFWERHINSLNLRTIVQLDFYLCDSVAERL